MKHIFLTGEKNCGKTTLLTQALAEFRVSGFSSKILPPNEIRLFRASLWFGSNSVFAKNGVNFSKDHASNATLIPACVEAFFEKSEENLAGVCGVRDSFTQAFERLGVEILQEAWRGRGEFEVVAMDEVGFLEARSPSFQEEILRLLAQNASVKPVLGVVKKEASTPFLQRIHTHENVELISVEKQNAQEVLRYIKSWLKECQGRFKV